MKKETTTENGRPSGTPDKIIRRFFRDKESGPNLQDGVEFHPAGIVLEKCGDNTPSGKDLAVLFFDPFTATVECSWRSIDEVFVYDATEEHNTELWLSWEETKKSLEALDAILNT